MYMTRQLNFAGVTFDIKELPLSLDFIEMYNDSVKLLSGTCVNRDGLNSFLLSISSLLAMLSSCGLLLYFVKFLWTLIILSLLLLPLPFSKIPREIMLQYLVEPYFMCTVDSLLLTTPRTCMCIHFLFIFLILITVAEHGTIGRFCRICVSHLPVSHVTALEIWQFSFARCCN